MDGPPPLQGLEAVKVSFTKSEHFLSSSHPKKKFNVLIIKKKKTLPPHLGLAVSSDLLFLRRNMQCYLLLLILGSLTFCVKPARISPLI